MTVHWIYLLIGLGFGLIPPLRLLNTECRYLTFEELWTRVLRRFEDGQKRRRWWKLPLVWIDPLRGYVVGKMLSQAFAPAQHAGFIQAQLPVLVLLAAVMLVLMVQTKGRPYERESLSPAGFLAGMMFAMMDPVISIGAVVLGGSTMIALQRYSYGYWAATLVTAGVGFVFMRANPMLGVFVMMVSAPAWMSWLRGTMLVMPVRC
jgi:hypothetical protein